MYMYVFMKTMCFVATHALGHMMYGCTVVPSYIYISIYIYIYIYILSFKEIKQNFLFSLKIFKLDQCCSSGSVT